MFTRRFWLDALERVVSTAAQSAVAAIGTTAAVQAVDWRVVGGVTALAAVLALLKAVALGPMKKDKEDVGSRS